jgi:branched-chain amino acid transport system substrate-binding protein
MKTRYTILSLMVAGGLTMSACGSAGGSGSAAEVVIGTSLPLSGALQAFGSSLRVGYQQAVDEVNAAGGIGLGGTKHQVRLVVQDNASSGDKASAQARDLVLNRKAVALLGPATPTLSIPVSVVADQLKIPTLVTITPLKAWQGGNSSGWRYSWDVFFDETQMTGTQFQTASLIGTNKKVALFTDQEEDGHVMGGLWTSTATQFGYRLAYHAEFPVGTTNFSTQVAEAKAAGADVVIAQVIPPDGISLLREMKTQVWQPKLVFLEKAGNTGNYPKLSGGLAEGTLAANWFAKGMGLPREDDFIGKYSTQTGGVNSDLGTIVYGYSVTKVLLDAFAAAGSTKADAVNGAIAKTSGEYPAGKIAFPKAHSSPMPAVQTQWQGNDMVLVLNADGKGTNTLQTPTSGLG